MRFILLILGSLLSVYAAAGVYKCTDANGGTEYRSNPCPPGRNNIRINVKTGSSTDIDEQQKRQILEQKKNRQFLNNEKVNNSNY